MVVKAGLPEVAIRCPHPSCSCLKAPMLYGTCYLSAKVHCYGSTCRCYGCGKIAPGHSFDRFLCRSYSLAAGIPTAKLQLLN